MWRKLRIPFALLLVVVVATHADTPPTGKAQLRKLAELPTVSFQFGLAYNGIDGLTEAGTTLDPAEEIAALQKATQQGPSDAERYYRLSQLYSKNDADKDQAKASLDKSIELYRHRVEQQPENARLLADFGEALGDTENHQEAEHLLRKAVQLATNDWHVWVKLGTFLQSEVCFLLYNNEDAKEWSPDALLKMAAMVKPSPDKLKQAEDAMAEAMTCFDRAVTAAPDEPEVYLKRAFACFSRNTFRTMVMAAKGEEANADKITRAFISGEGAAEDLKAAVRLDPKNYRAIRAVIMLEVLGAAAQPVSSVNSGDNLVKSLPDKSQQVVRDGMISLQKLEDEPNPRLAAGALETEGSIEFALMGDQVNGEKKLRRALALDPGRDQAAEMLAGLLARSGNFTEMLPVCEARAKRNPTPRNLLLVAKAQEKLGRPADAEQQMQAAVQLAPDDFASQIGLAAMLLKHTDEESLSHAADHIRLAKAALNKLPGGTGTPEQETDYVFTAGLYQGLTGNTDRAREAFNLILKNDPGNQSAKSALAALGN